MNSLANSMLLNICIRQADINEYQTLTSISFAAKRHWNYAEEYYERWKEELTITEDYIRKNLVYVAVYKDEIIGFYSIVENLQDFWTGKVFVSKGFWLEHIFIKPEYHGLRVGRQLMEHTMQIALTKEIETLWIFVDPYAKGFYDKIGAKFVRESPSSIEGRMIPVYELSIKGR